MVNPVINQTNIVAPRVPLIDERTGLISREWYRFFLNLFVLTGSGQNDVSLLDLQVGPPTQPLIDVDSLNPEPNGLAAYAAGSTQESQIAELQKQIEALALTTQSVDLSEVWKQLQALQVVPPSQLDALTTGAAILYGNGSGGFSNVTIGTGVSFTSGTLSAIGTGGTVTAVTATAPVSSSGGTTPDISMAAASTSADGYLTSTDWNTFNNKTSNLGTVTSVAALTLGTTGADLSSTVANGTTTPVITLQVPTASAANRGALSSADWSTFNSKQPAGTYVTSVSVVSANGLAGTSSGGATPALTLSTSVTGLLKGNGTAISAALANTDYVGISAPVVKTADFSVVNGEAWLINNKSGSTCTVTLPTASSWAGRVLHFQNYQSQTLVSASSNVTLVDGSATGTAILSASAGDSATLVSDGSNWLTTQYASNNNLLLE